MLVDAGGVAQAINSDAIVPCFQPLVDLRTGSLVGFEVLARWRHPQHGLVLPGNFIALTEQGGLIDALTQQMLRKFMKSVVDMPQLLSFSFNISPMQLRDLTLPDQIRQIAENTGFDLSRLVVEITETALVDDLETAQSIAASLKNIGCRLALDDFGTGYSSLQYLQALPFDELKIDRSFVSTMNTRRESRKIAAAVVGLGHSLGLSTVAEGIETKEQADMLLALGCELGQGWLYGKPVPVEELPALLKADHKITSAGTVSASTEWVVNSLEALPAQRLAQLQAIYNSAPVGLCFLDRNLRYVSLNRRLAEINQKPVSAHIGAQVRDIVSKQYYEKLEPYLLRALQGETVLDLELVKPPPSPGLEAHTLLITYQPVFDEGNEVTGLSVVIADISERKRAEDAQRVSQEHYRNMVDLNPHILWILDKDGNLVDYGQQWRQFTGMGPEETLNWGWISGLHPEDQEPTIHRVKESLVSGQKIDIEYRLRTIDGTWRWMRTRGTPRREANGKIMLWYGCLEDIDEFKRTLDALHRVQSQLMALQGIH